MLIAFRRRQPARRPLIRRVSFGPPPLRATTIREPPPPSSGPSPTSLHSIGPANDNATSPARRKSAQRQAEEGRSSRHRNHHRAAGRCHFAGDAFAGSVSEATAALALVVLGRKSRSASIERRPQGIFFSRDEMIAFLLQQKKSYHGVRGIIQALFGQSLCAAARGVGFEAIHGRRY